MKQTIYDPPEGWRYGFPKPYKPLTGEELRDTLKRDGYPEELMDIADRATRFWEEERVEASPASPGDDRKGNRPKARGVRGRSKARFVEGCIC